MSDIVSRVKERLNALNLTATDATVRGGFKRTFVQDLIAGKKKTIKGDALLTLAGVLECSPQYLVGETDEIAATPVTASSEIPLAGICEVGVWRDERMPSALPPTITATLSDYPQDAKVAYLVQGHGAEDAGVPSQSLVIGVRPQFAHGGSGDIRAGDIVVVKRRRNSTGDSETSVRRVEMRDGRKVLVAPSKVLADLPPVPISDAGTDETVVVEALVLRCIILLAPDERIAVLGRA